MKQEEDGDKKGKDRLRHFGHKILVLSGKGGIGKSTMATNLSAALAQRGYDVGLLDIDIHGPSMPKMSGIENERPATGEAGIGPIPSSRGLKVMSMALLLQDRDMPVIWLGPLKMLVIRQLIGDVYRGERDLFTVDLSPGTGDEPLSIAQLMPNYHGAVAVTTPEDVALVRVRKSIDSVLQMNKPVIGNIENMSGFRFPSCGDTIDMFKSNWDRAPPESSAYLSWDRHPWTPGSF